MKNRIFAAIAMVSVGIVAGCGGSGSTSSNPTSISGKVADGYLENAKVFLDKHNNYQLDPNQNFAMTNDKGEYTLNVDPGDVGKYPIVALAIKGVTKDWDTGVGVTVTNSYVLSMPKDSISGKVNSNFISPMSSQLRVMMDTGNYVTMQDAMTALNTKLGLGGTTNLMADYLATGTSNATVHTAATNMATLMGSQMNLVLSTSGSSTSVDVGRYQGMMVAIFKNMSSIKGSSPNTQSTMSNLMGTMTTTLQGTPAGTPFRNISTAIRGMMGASGSSTIGGMMK